MDGLARFGAGVARVTFYLVMAAGLWLMGEASTSYLELGSEHPFLLEKLPLAQPAVYRAALYAHVPTALFALPACLVLLSGWVRRHWPRFHRYLGRVTGALILTVMVPSGAYLALFAQGGLVTTLGFWLTGAITWWAMAQSIRSARARQLVAHRRYSAHVVAQLSVAVLSRFMLAGAELLELYDTWVYIAALWLPVVGCAIVAELWTSPRSSSTSKGPDHETLVAAARLDVVR